MCLIVTAHIPEADSPHLMLTYHKPSLKANVTGFHYCHGLLPWPVSISVSVTLSVSTSGLLWLWLTAFLSPSRMSLWL